MQPFVNDRAWSCTREECIMHAMHVPEMCRGICLSSCSHCARTYFVPVLDIPNPHGLIY